MKKIFLDTNFILDYFIREDFNGDAERLLAFGKNSMRFHISYLTVANFAYIMRKMPRETLLSIIQNMCETFNVVKNTKEQILRNIIQNPSDFEDGLQYQAAIDAGCECIITRNQKDFRFADIPVMSPSEFLEGFMTE